MSHPENPDEGQAARAPVTPLHPPEDEFLLRRRRRDAAVALPFLGIMLFVSPLVDLATVGATIIGVPMSVTYIFGGWFLLIALVAWHSRCLARGGEL